MDKRTYSLSNLFNIGNSEWLESMNFADVLRLASSYTVARMMERR